MNEPWERQITALLNELSSTQDELFSLLDEKRRAIVSRDTAFLAALVEREQAIVTRLQGCQSRRRELLDRAQAQQLPGDSIRSLAKTLPVPGRQELTQQVDEAAKRFALLGHQSLANWVLIQRSLLHLSQLLEIIATGGRKSPTYGKVASAQASGSLVNQAA